MSNSSSSTQQPTYSAADPSTTASHPDPSSLDPTTAPAHHAAQGGLSTTHAARAAELAGLTKKLKSGLRQFPDFPSPGILFEDIMPLFSDHILHTNLIRALELEIEGRFGEGIDVVVGLESRGFLFGPTLAFRLGAGFVPVRKQGKLPGQCETEGFKKEYGEDFFQMQSDAIKPGEKVVIVDDIIATGGSAAAAGNLVTKLGGKVLGYVFLMELDFLKGRDKLGAPVYTLLSGQDAALGS